MNHTESRLKKLGRVLSIDPRTERIAWTFFQDSAIRDQRIQTFRQRQPAERVREVIVPCLVRLLDDFAPHALLVPESDGIGGRHRSEHVAETLNAVVAEAERRGIAVHVLSNEIVKQSFAQARGIRISNKREIQGVVVEQYPQMLAVLPRPRTKAWQSERYFDPLFHTVAMFISWRIRFSLNEVRERRVA